MRLLLLLLLAVPLSAKDTVETLMKLDEQFCSDTAAKGVEGWLSYFADHTAVFPPSGPILRTKAQATEFYRKAFGTGPISLRWKPQGGMISASGDFGFTYGTWQDGARSGKYLTTWSKQEDGSWKISGDIGAPDSPAKK